MKVAASMEEVLSQAGASPKMSFRFTQLSRLPLIHSILLGHQWAHSTTPDNWMCYCAHIRVALLGEGQSTPPFHMWCRSLIADILQEACPRYCITKAVVLALGEAILFFGRHLHKEGLLYRNTKDIELSSRGPVNWARRTAQV